MSTTLYTKDSKGKTRLWRVSDVTVDASGVSSFTLTHGIEGGKLQEKLRTIKKGKNIGKANETTPEQQAEAEIASLIQAQLDQGYVYDIADWKEPFRPMLAHKYQDHSSKIDWSQNVYVSPKLDGIRCFIIIDENQNISFISRTGKPFKYLEHIADAIKHSSLNVANSVLDGELYNHELTFQQISSLVNTSTYDILKDQDIKFYMYDRVLVLDKDLPYSKRMPLGASVSSSESSESPLVLLPQLIIKNESELIQKHSEWVSEGYEGAMVRSGSTPYQFGKRSTSLLKYKVMETEEFEILNVYLARNDESKVQVTLKAKNGEPFDVGSIKGTKEEVMSTYYEAKDEVIGKYATVQYQTLSPYGIPLFPVLIAIREGEVIDGEFVPSV